MKKYFYIILLASISLSCSKEDEKIIDFNPDFEGRWSSDNYLEITGGLNEHWVIESSSEGYYSYSSGLSDALTEEGTVTINEGQIKIDGKHSSDEQYSIDEAPVKLESIGNIWRMRIAGTTYYSDKNSQAVYWTASSHPSCDVWNSTSDTVYCTINGVPRVMPNNTGIPVGDVFGETNTYSDNLGNSFTYIAIFPMEYDL